MARILITADDLRRRAEALEEEARRADRQIGKSRSTDFLWRLADEFRLLAISAEDRQAESASANQEVV